MHEETRSVSEGCEEGEGAGAHQESRVLLSPGWAQAELLWQQDTAQAPGGGDCPGAPARLCPVRPEATALGTLPCPLVRVGYWDVFLLQDPRSWPSWSLALPHGFFKLDGPGLTSPEHGQ